MKKGGFTDHEIKLMGMRKQVTKALNAVESDTLRRDIQMALYRGINMSIGAYDKLLETSGQNITEQVALLGKFQDDVKKVKVALHGMAKLLDALNASATSAPANSVEAAMGKNLTVSACRNFQMELAHRLRYCELLANAVEARFEANQVNVDVAKSSLQSALNKNVELQNTEQKMKYCQASAQHKLAEMRAQVAVAALEDFVAVYDKSSGQLSVPTEMRKMDVLLKLAKSVVAEDHAQSAVATDVMVEKTRLQQKEQEITRHQSSMLESAGVRSDSPQFKRVRALEKAQFNKAVSDLQATSPYLSSIQMRKIAKQNVKEEVKAQNSELQTLRNAVDVAEEKQQFKKDQLETLQTFFTKAVADNRGTKAHMDLMLSVDDAMQGIIAELPKMYFDIDRAKTEMPKIQRMIAQKQEFIDENLRFVSRPELDHEANQELITAFKQGQPALAEQLYKASGAAPLVIRSFDPDKPESFVTNIEMAQLQKVVFERYPELAQIYNESNIGRVKEAVKQTSQYQGDPELDRFLTFFTINKNNTQNFSKRMDDLLFNIKSKAEFETTLQQLQDHIQKHPDATEQNPAGVVSISNTDDFALTLADEKYQGADAKMKAAAQYQCDLNIDMAITNQVFGKDMNFEEYKAFVKAVKPMIEAMQRVDELTNKTELSTQEEKILAASRELMQSDEKLVEKILECRASTLEMNQPLLSKVLEGQNVLGDSKLSLTDMQTGSHMVRAFYSQLSDTKAFIADDTAVNEQDLIRRVTSSQSFDSSLQNSSDFEIEFSSDDIKGPSSETEESAPQAPGRRF